MPRPKSKTELLLASEKNFSRLFDLIDSMSESQQQSEFTGNSMNRNIRDVLAHLYHWHSLFFNWYEIGMAGDKPQMPAEGYTWKTTSMLNQYIFDLYKHEDLEDLKRKLRKSHDRISDIVKKHSNEELFTKKKYKWTGSTSLGAYLVSSTSSHYDWAFKLIKKGMA